MGTNAEARDKLRSNVANNVRRLRLAHGMSQWDLVLKTGYSAGHVSVVERGLQSTSLDFIAHVAPVFGIEPADLLRDED